MRSRIWTSLAVTLCAAACQPSTTDLRAFGSMREVMRQGQDEGRVDLHPFTATKAIGVGALADLAGEVTIIDGQVLVATVTDGAAAVRTATDQDRATLLLAQEVPAWHKHPIDACADYAELERRIAEALSAHGFDLDTPTPIRVTGATTRLQVHVIAGACPIATPQGPKPWRYDGPADNVRLVGFYVENAAGKWTHHNHQSHLHAVSDQAMGHLDEVTMTAAVLWLPAPGPPADSGK